MKLSGNTVTWKIKSAGELKMTGNGSMTFDGEERHMGESTFNMPDAKHGPTTMNQKYSGGWLATACK